MTKKPNKKARSAKAKSKRPSKGFFRRNRGLIAGAAGVLALAGGAYLQTRKRVEEPEGPSAE